MPARRYSAHLGYMFTELPLEARFAAAAAAGFREVEHPGPYGLTAERVRALCDQHNLSFVQMALPAGDAARGEKGIACLIGREQEFRQSVETGLAYAQAIGSRFVHVMAGVVSEPEVFDAARECYITNLRFACDAAASRGMTLLVEPIGVATISGYLVDHPAKALRAIADVGASNLRMLFDAFHATNAGVDAITFVQQHPETIAHIHIADHPGRHEPGTGTFDFTRFFEALDRVGYLGSVGLEYIPAGNTREGLSWRSRF